MILPFLPLFESMLPPSSSFFLHRFDISVRRFSKNNLIVPSGYVPSACQFPPAFKPVNISRPSSIFVDRVDVEQALFTASRTSSLKTRFRALRFGIMQPSTRRGPHAAQMEKTFYLLVNAAYRLDITILSIDPVTAKFCFNGTTR